MFKIIQKFSEEAINWFWDALQKMTETTLVFIRKSVQRVSRFFTFQNSSDDAEQEDSPVIIANTVSEVCSPTRYNQLPKPKTGMTPERPTWKDSKCYRKYTADLILELRKTGMTLKEIAEQLYEREIKTRTGKPQWSTGTLSKIIRNEGSPTAPTLA